MHTKHEGDTTIFTYFKVITFPGFLYTGTADGKVLRIDLKRKTLSTLAILGIPCGEYSHIRETGNQLIPALC